MKLSFMAVVLLTASAFAQNQPPIQSQQAPPPTQTQEWLPSAVASLGQNASARTEFTLTHSMLVLASKMDQDDADLRRVIAGVDGISVHRFHFPGDEVYDPAALNAVRQEYRAAGWQHISASHNKNGGPEATDLWLHLEKNAIRNIAVLVTGRNQINLISVSGSISPIDLLHLAGHFGIPPIQGGIAIPAPNPPPERASPQPAY